ncbi:tetratricopeptide repeat protein [Pendulispora brunnea]|uniref:Tetratricopeptide repeat protein n=1 Tax=Pendulispora brunnea TaxID=2905690 RepID=A0ABZ2K2N3_9BACT
MRRSVFRAWVSVVGVCACFAYQSVSPVSSAWAQTGESLAAGRALFDEGMQLFERGKYADACPKFEASLARLPGNGTRGKLAECYEKIGRTASAWALYREVAVLAARAGDATRQQVASDRAKALEPKLARVTVKATATPGLVVKRNGEPLVPGELGSAIAVDPGDITIEASAPERKPWSHRVKIEQGGSLQVEIPPLPPVEAPRAVAQTAPPPPREEETPAPRSSGLGWQRTAGIVAGGAGLATMLVGGYFALSAKSTYDDAFNGDCSHADNTCTAAGQRDTESAHDKATVSTILVGTGAAIAVTGAVLFFTAPKAPSNHAVRVTPSVGLGQAGLVVSGRL